MMKYLFIIILFFISNSIFAKGPYQFELNSIPDKECSFVTQNYNKYISHMNTSTPSIEERLAYDKFEKIISFYRGYEIGFADGKNIGMNVSISTEDLSLLLFTKCKNNSSKKIFIIVQEIYNFYQN